jgi:hypothetical protein
MRDSAKRVVEISQDAIDRYEPRTDWLEKPGMRWLKAPESVIVEHHAAKITIVGQRTGLRLDGLAGEDATDRSQLRIAIQQFDVPGQLFDSIQAGHALDLHGPMPSVGHTAFCTSCSQSTLTTITNTDVYISRHWHAPVQSSCQPQRSDLRLAKKTQPAAFVTATGVVFTQGITRKRLPASRGVLPYMPYLPPTKESGPLTPEELR